MAPVAKKNTEVNKHDVMEVDVVPEKERKIKVQAEQKTVSGDPGRGAFDFQDLSSSLAAHCPYLPPVISNSNDAETTPDKQEISGKDGLVQVKDKNTMETKPHIVYSFKGDVRAKTTDPEVMETNYRFPIRYVLRERVSGKTRISKVADAKDEFIISRDFVESFNCPKLTASLAKLERYLGKYRSKEGRRPVIKWTPIDTISNWTLTDKYSRKFRREEKKKKKALKALDAKSRQLHKKNKSIIVPQDEIEMKPLLESAELLPEEELISEAHRFDKPPKWIRTIYDSETVAKSGISFEDIHWLRKGKYLSDGMLTYGIMRVFESVGSPSDVLCFPAFFWSQYISVRYEKKTNTKIFYRSLKRLLEKGENILEKKFWVVPVLIERHWSLVVLCSPFPDENDILRIDEGAKKAAKVGHDKSTTYRSYSEWLYSRWISTSNRKQPMVLIFDSLIDRVEEKMGADGVHVYHKVKTTDNLLKALMDIHRLYWKESGRSFHVAEEDFTKIRFQTMKVPGQLKGSACGFFIIDYLKMWLSEMAARNGDYVAVYKDDFSLKFNNEFKFSVTPKKLADEILEQCKERCKPETYNAMVRLMESESFEIEDSYDNA